LVFFVDIDGIVDYHCLNFLFILNTAVKTKMVRILF